MYRWYRNAQVCYAYLYDVPSVDFKDSIYWTRGWTLQELIAPQSLLLFDCSWNEIGDRSSLAAKITEITTIPIEILHGQNPLWQSIAERMRWASRRVTTRTEDIAYCLMGLFDVNMPLLYGEGPKAFRRLQQEIIKSSDDDSIFAWQTVDSPASELHHGPLALSPAYFRTPTLCPQVPWGHSPSVSSTGAHTSLLLRQSKEHPRLYQAILRCSFEEHRHIHPAIWLLLTAIDTRHLGEHVAANNKDPFVRVLAHRIEIIDIRSWNMRRCSELLREIVMTDVTDQFLTPSRPELKLLIVPLLKPTSIVGLQYFPMNLVESAPGKLAGLIYRDSSLCFVIAVGISAFGQPWSETFQLEQSGNFGVVTVDEAEQWYHTYVSTDGSPSSPFSCGPRYRTEETLFFHAGLPHIAVGFKYLNWNAYDQIGRIGL